MPQDLGVKERLVPFMCWLCTLQFLQGQSTVCRTCRSDPCLALSAHNQDAVAQPAATDMLRVTVHYLSPTIHSTYMYHIGPSTLAP